LLLSNIRDSLVQSVILFCCGRRLCCKRRYCLWKKLTLLLHRQCQVRFATDSRLWSSF